MRVIFLVLFSLAMGCTTSPAALLGQRCRTASDCDVAAGLDCFGRCLTPGGDFDGDGVANSNEGALSLDPLLADTDGDGRLDGDELLGADRDADRDGSIDARERSDRDADGDCLVDERDPDDATPETRELELRRACPSLGACVNTFARQRAACADGQLTCTLDGSPIPTETCNDVDDDCDGVTDEGCPGKASTRGPFAPVREPDEAPFGRLIITKPFALTLPGDEPLPEALRVLELQQVIEVEARCTPREAGVAVSPISFSVTPPSWNLRRYEVLSPDKDPAPTPRDALGRPASLTAPGPLVGAIDLSHLAGTYAVLRVRCEGLTASPGYAPLTLSVPVKVAASQPASSGCSSSGAGAVAGAALLVFARRRRRAVATAVAMAGAVLTACAPSPTTPAQPGVGVTNGLPLWPMGGGALSTTSDPAPLARAIFPLGKLRGPMSSSPGATGITRRLDLADSIVPSSIGLDEDRDGNLFITASRYGPLSAPLLLVPKTVRVGMRWEGRAKLETDSLFHDLELPLVFDDTLWRFTVSHRQVVHTRFGQRIVWRIEWLGPVVPYAKAPDETRALVDHGNEARKAPPIDEFPRLRGFIDLVEGSGPVDMQLTFAALDVFHEYWTDKTYGAPPSLRRLDVTAAPEAAAQTDEAAVLAERAFPPLVDADGAQLPLADATPQEAPALELTRSTAILQPDGMVPEQLWLTRSSKEPENELVIFGKAVSRSTLIGPSGETTMAAFASASVACGLVSDDGQVRSKTNQPCPGRIENGARPWVGPDGQRWDTKSIEAVRAATSSSSRVAGYEPEAPLWYGGRFFVFGYERNAAGRAPPSARVFGTTPAVDLLDEPGVPGDTIPGATRFQLSATPARAAGVTFATSFGDRIAVVRTSDSAARFDENSAPLPHGEVRWFDENGFDQQAQQLISSRPGWSLRDGVHVLTEVGRAGELRLIHVERDRVWAELLGSLQLPPGHVAGGAVSLGGDRYFVVTQEAPELRVTGWALSSRRANFTLQVTPRAGALFGHVVTAPSTQLTDESWLLRHVSVTRGDGVLKVCVPRGSGLKVDALRVGEAERSLVPRGDRCWVAPLEGDDVARSAAVGWTPVSLRVEGRGWLRRQLAPVGSPENNGALEGTAAPLRDGSLRFVTTVVEPNDTGRTPASSAVPLLTPLPWGPDLSRLVSLADTRGAGLWVSNGVTPVLSPKRCTTMPCLDGPYAPDPVPAGKPWVLLGAKEHRTFWVPAGVTVAAPGGGLIGPGWHLSEDGAVTTLPGSTMRTARFLTMQWFFLNGTICGALTAAEGGGLGCIAADGTRQALPASAAGSFAQEPGFLVKGVLEGTQFFVELVDVVRGGGQRVLVGQADAAAGPVQGTDGTAWWVLSGATPRRVGVRAGLVEVTALERPERDLFSATADTLYWASGRTSPRTSGSSTCVPQSERCNGLDDDCNGAVDELGDALCTVPNANSRCAGGRCSALVCGADFADCNGQREDGCETPLGSVQHCGGCGRACSVGFTCDAGACSPPPPPRLSAGDFFACALHAPGEAHCLAGPWPTTSPPNFPNRLTHPADGDQLVTGAAHACVRRAGVVSCWGQTDVALGPAGSSGAVRDVPLAITGLTDATSLWAGGRSTCAKRTSGELWCWGPVLTGLTQPAPTTDLDRYLAWRVPTRITGWDGVVTLALSGDRACGIRSDQSVGCFGPNASGAFEDVTFSLTAAATRVWGAPAPFSGSGTFVFEAGTTMSGLGALQAITVLGGPSAGPYTTPQPLPGLAGAREVALGASHLCALFATEVRCAGTNTFGQLGRPDNAGVFASWVTHSGTFTSAAATGDSSCFVGGDGSISCAGKLVEVSGYSPRSTVRPITLRAP
ncbi:MAG: hypothetical protein JNM69_32895 [Archangium sp.]|nr:hypothetical protein [Archangium sp.]